MCIKKETCKSTQHVYSTLNHPSHFIHQRYPNDWVLKGSWSDIMRVSHAKTLVTIEERVLPDEHLEEVTLTGIRRLIRKEH